MSANESTSTANQEDTYAKAIEREEGYILTIKKLDAEISSLTEQNNALKRIVEQERNHRHESECRSRHENIAASLAIAMASEAFGACVQRMVKDFTLAARDRSVEYFQEARPLSANSDSNS